MAKIKYHICIDRDLAEFLANEANKEHRSLSNYIGHVLYLHKDAIEMVKNMDTSD